MGKGGELERSRKVRSGRLRGEPAPERPDMDRFWERVHETSSIRDAVKRQRR